MDPITNKKLRKYANLHHLDLDEKHYEDLSNSDNFVYVNHNTHEWIHQIYTYYKNDPEVLDRLKSYLDKMTMLNTTLNKINKIGNEEDNEERVMKE